MWTDYTIAASLGWKLSAKRKPQIYYRSNVRSSGDWRGNKDNECEIINMSANRTLWWDTKKYKVRNILVHYLQREVLCRYVSRYTQNVLCSTTQKREKIKSWNCESSRKTIFSAPDEWIFMDETKYKIEHVVPYISWVIVANWKMDNCVWDPEGAHWIAPKYDIFTECLLLKIQITVLRGKGNYIAHMPKP